MAPYANIFMGYLEQSFLFALPDDKKPCLWKIFIDDVFFNLDPRRKISWNLQNLQIPVVWQLNLKFPIPAKTLIS